MATCSATAGDQCMPSGRAPVSADRPLSAAQPARSTTRPGWSRRGRIHPVVQHLVRRPGFHGLILAIHPGSARTGGIRLTQPDDSTTPSASICSVTSADRRVHQGARLRGGDRQDRVGLVVQLAVVHVPRGAHHHHHVGVQPAHRGGEDVGEVVVAVLVDVAVDDPDRLGVAAGHEAAALLHGERHLGHLRVRRRPGDHSRCRWPRRSSRRRPGCAPATVGRVGPSSPRRWSSARWPSWGPPRRRSMPQPSPRRWSTTVVEVVVVDGTGPANGTAARPACCRSPPPRRRRCRRRRTSPAGARAPPGRRRPRWRRVP